jgi:hypothetical protein
MSIKLKYQVKPIESNQCKEWLLNKHYAKRLCNIRYSFGLYNTDLNILVGIVTFGNLASPAPCVGVCGPKYKNEVIELNRLCINDDECKNAASFLVGNALRMINGPKIIISYADTSQNHVGYVYQATNWIYTGLSAKRTDPDHNAKNVHNRNSFIKGLPQKERPRKHRYIYFIGDKKQITERKNALKYPIEKYPKGESKKYDASYMPQVQISLF